MLMRRLAGICYITILVLSLVILPQQAHSQHGAAPSIKLKPEMNITVFPDGSLGISYKLDILVKLPPEVAEKKPRGRLLFNIIYFESNDTVRFSSGGAFEFAVGTLDELVEAYSISHYFKIDLESSSTSRTAYLRGSGEFQAKKMKGGGEEYLSVRLQQLNVTVKDLESRASSEAVVETNNETVLEKLADLANRNASYINDILKRRGLDFIEVTRYSSSLRDNSFYAVLEVLASIERLLDDSVSKGVLSVEDREAIENCLLGLYSDLEGFLRGAASIVYERYENGNSTMAKFEYEGELRGDIALQGRHGIECGMAYYKLTQLLMNETGPPLRPAPAPPTGPAGGMGPPANMKEMLGVRNVSLVPVRPYQARFFLRAVVGEGEAEATILFVIQRVRHPGEGDWVELARKGLGELSSVLENASRRLGFLELMGIGSPVPDRVNIRGGGLQGVYVVLPKESVRISELPYIEMALSAPTQPPTKTATTIRVTVTAPPQETSPTITGRVEVVSTTVTKTITVTETRTITTTYREAVKELPPTTALAIAVIAFAVGALLAYIAGRGR